MPVIAKQPGIDDALADLGIPVELHHKLISHPMVQQAVLGLDHIYGRVLTDHARIGYVPHEHQGPNRQLMDDVRRVQAIHNAAAGIISYLMEEAQRILSPLGTFQDQPKDMPTNIGESTPPPEGNPDPDDPTSILSQSFPAPEPEPEPEAPPETPLQPEGEPSPEAPAKKRKGS